MMLHKPVVFLPAHLKYVKYSIRTPTINFNAWFSIISFRSNSKITQRRAMIHLIVSFRRHFRSVRSEISRFDLKWLLIVYIGIHPVLRFNNDIGVMIVNRWALWRHHPRVIFTILDNHPRIIVKHGFIIKKTQSIIETNERGCYFYRYV